MPVPAFGDIGKATKELLTGNPKAGGFVLDPKFTLSSSTGSGVAFTCTAVKQGDKILPSLKTAYSTKKYSADATVNSSEKVAINTSFSEVAPGVKVNASVTLPDPSSAKVGVEYVNPYLNVKSSVSLTSAPIVDLAASSGYKNVVFGADASYNTSKAAIAKWSAAVGYQVPSYQVAASVLDLGNTVKLVYAHNVSPTQTVGAEIVRKIPAATTSFTLGYSRKLTSGALTKLKVDNSGMMQVMYETKLSSGEKVSGALQLQATDLTKPVKYGFSVDFL
jgi:voltage-dependent anion channel protein 2